LTPFVGTRLLPGIIAPAGSHFNIFPSSPHSPLFISDIIFIVVSLFSIKKNPEAPGGLKEEEKEKQWSVDGDGGFQFASRMVPP
jgi:hypothetical protein